MKLEKDECLKCGGNSTLRYPGTINCLECGHVATTPRATRQRSSPAPAITVSRYQKADGFPTRHFAIHVDGSLLAVTVYRKGAEAVRVKIMEILDGAATSPALASTTN